MTREEAIKVLSTISNVEEFTTKELVELALIKLSAKPRPSSISHYGGYNKREDFGDDYGWIN